MRTWKAAKLAFTADSRDRPLSHLVIAPSTLGEVAGLGVFASAPLPAGLVIPYVCKATSLRYYPDPASIDVQDHAVKFVGLESDWCAHPPW